MNYKSFPAAYWSEIEAAILRQQERQKEKGPTPVAAFDADGTLWDTDLGENFFQYQIDNKLVPLPDDPWAHYLNMKKINNDPREAYVWLAQINNGIREEQVRAWAQAAFDSITPSPVFSEQKKLITLLKDRGVKVYIVTASIRWAVEPGARALGLGHENVIGVETLVTGGKLTAEKVLPITYRAGKLKALLAKTSGQAPFLASGNTIGDYELLEAATDIRLAVSAASRDDRLFKSENELLAKAEENNWWRHRFI